MIIELFPLDDGVQDEQQQPILLNNHHRVNAGPSHPVIRVIATTPRRDVMHISSKVS